MRPTVQKITELFSLQRRFVVPLFQRPYVWKLDEQWLPLWRDILRQTKKLIQVGSNDPLPADATHFMGAIVVQSEIPDGGARTPTLTIIDGQQRLVTFQIMLAAIRDRLREEEDPYLGQFQNLTTNLPPHIGDEDQFKVWPTNKDRSAFREAMTIGHLRELKRRHGVAAGSLPQLLSAYSFFFNAFSEYLDASELEDDHEDAWQISDYDAPSRVRALFQALSQSLRFVVIELDESEDPQIIFESLNARGEPLLPSDLIKNYLFLEAGDQADQLYDQYWQHFEEPTWSAKLPQIKIAELEHRSMIDVLFRTYLLVQPDRAEININRLYLEFKDWRVKTRNDRGIAELLAEIHRYSLAFKGIVTETSTASASSLYRAILATDDFVAMPLVLHLVAKHEGASQLDDVLGMIESFVVRRWFCEEKRRNQSTAQAQVHLYAKLLRGVRALSSGNLRDGVCELLRDAEHKGRKSWPSDEEFREGWRARSVFYPTRRERARVILSALARKTSQDHLLAVGDFEIEHILPEEADENTHPFSRADQTYQANAELRRALKDTVGNLTFLEKALNRAASNRSFSQKRELYRKSVLPSVVEIAGVERWAEDEIVGRSDRLFAAATAAWPRS